MPSHCTLLLCSSPSPVHVQFIKSFCSFQLSVWRLNHYSFFQCRFIWLSYTFWKLWRLRLSSLIINAEKLIPVVYIVVFWIIFVGCFNISILDCRRLRSSSSIVEVHKPFNYFIFAFQNISIVFLVTDFAD
jgi:hypothetical protein